MALCILLLWRMVNLHLEVTSQLRLEHVVDWISNIHILHPYFSRQAIIALKLQINCDDKSSFKIIYTIINNNYIIIIYYTQWYKIKRLKCLKSIQIWIDLTLGLIFYWNGINLTLNTHMSMSRSKTPLILSCVN